MCGIKMLPLSFAEFVDFYGFTIKTVKSALGGQKKKAVDQDGTQYELREIFDATCALAACPVLPTSAWNRIRR